MNILPKKSWHVLSKQNIDRVRKDEAEAKAQEEEKQRRAEFAEREARLELMRKRARQREDYDEDEDDGDGGERKGGTAVKLTSKESQPSEESGKHINFFQDVKKGVGLQSTNEEHDAEQKADQEKLEKRIGLLNYLVDKDKSADPWYVKHKSASEESAKSRRRKERMDPLNDMKHFVEAKKKCLDKSSDQPPLLPAASYYKSLSSSSSHGHSQSAATTTPEHKGKSKKHKKQKNSKEKEKERARLEEMRRKRRLREEAERTRTEAMLRQHYGEGGKETQSANSGPQMVEEMPGRYNSQFNPHLARHYM